MNGTWQIQTALRKITKQRGIVLSASWSKFFNLRHETAKSVQKSGMPDLAACMAALGLSSDHVTLGMCAQAAAMATAKLVQNGHSFVKPVTWDPDTEPPTGHSGGGQVTVHGSCIRLRGVPFQAEAREVRDFFAGFQLNKVVMAYDSLLGRSKGEAYVTFFTDDEAARAAAERDRQMLGARYIEIFSATPEEVAEAERLSDEIQNNTSNILRLRGIPYSATDTDIQTFFLNNKVSIHPASVHIQMGPDGRPTGCAFVKAFSEEDKNRALELSRDSNRAYMGSRYVEVYRATETELQRAQRPQGVALHGGHGTDHVVKLRGLPYAANELDIANFFQGLNIAAQGIHLVYNADNRPSGEAFVELQTSQDVNGALAKDKYEYTTTRLLLPFFNSPPLSFVSLSPLFSSMSNTTHTTHITGCSLGRVTLRSSVAPRWRCRVVHPRPSRTTA